jgi:radical SAM/Cys-rich protein
MLAQLQPAGAPGATPRGAAPRARHAAALRRGAAAAAAAPPELAGSLVPQTLEELDADAELRALHARVAAGGQAELTAAEAARRQRALDACGAPPFGAAVAAAGAPPLRRGAATTLQLNVGLYCNQACRHCHVESSPRRAETMSPAVAARCIALLDASPSIRTLDLTGGAPEAAPAFRGLVAAGAARGLEVIDRCNLTILLEPGQEDLVAFLAAHRVRVVASLPCYTPAAVDAQRGGGVFRRSVEGLKRLNAAGYGAPGSGLRLDLVYNPGGAFLAPAAAALEPAYRRELAEAHGVAFSSLLCLNNMPIKRFADDLATRGELAEYMALLVASFNPAAAGALMCRDTVSVGWDGAVYDCDFNQQLALGLGGAGAPRTVFDVAGLGALEGRPVAVGSHCFGCTAGSGSGCQGGAA